MELVLKKGKGREERRS
jgi:hypothetical protein